jgi:hypothetical protein
VALIDDCDDPAASVVGVEIEVEEEGEVPGPPADAVVVPAEPEGEVEMEVEMEVVPVAPAAPAGRRRGRTEAKANERTRESARMDDPGTRPWMRARPLLIRDRLIRSVSLRVVGPIALFVPVPRQRPAVRRAP